NADAIDAKFKQFDTKAGVVTLQLESGKDQSYSLANRNVRAAGAFRNDFKLSELPDGLKVRAILNSKKEIVAIRVVHPTVKTRLLTIDVEKNAIRVERGLMGRGPTWLNLVSKPTILVGGKAMELRDVRNGMFATLTMSILKP